MVLLGCEDAAPAAGPPLIDVSRIVIPAGDAHAGFDREKFALTAHPHRIDIPERCQGTAIRTEQTGARECLLELAIEQILVSIVGECGEPGLGPIPKAAFDGGERCRRAARIAMLLRVRPQRFGLGEQGAQTAVLGARQGAKQTDGWKKTPHRPPSVNSGIPFRFLKRLYSFMQFSVSLMSFLVAIPVLAASAQAERGELLNSWEIHHELRVEPSAAPAVKEFFLSFLEYQDLVLFHPTLGYYSSGRVNFTSDYRTFPDALSPYFGQMIAQHIFNMWEGMRKAGTLQDE